MAWYKNIFKRKIKNAIKFRSFAGAQGGRLFADWKTSNATADQEIFNSLSTLRNRSRALARNDSYIYRYLNMLVSNVIGPNGIRVASKARNDNGELDLQGNKEVEAAFSEWGQVGSCTLNGIQSFLDCQKLFIESVARDGEALIRTVRSNSNRFGFAIQFLEADHLDENLSTKNQESGNSIKMGVEVDSFGKPEAYYLLKDHPGNSPYYSDYADPSRYIKVPADELIHGYLPNRAEQTRGVPWTSAVLGRAKMLDGLEESAVVNARVGASKMGFIVSPDGEQYVGEDTEDTYTQIMDATPGSMEQLPSGSEFRKWDPEYPNMMFDPFQKAILRGIASGLNVSYVDLANNLEGVNYSSIRQGVMEQRDYYRTIQKFVIQHMVRPIYLKWLEYAMTTKQVSIPITKYDKFANQVIFIPRSWSWIDPQKEMNANVVGLQNGQITMSDIQSSMGRDPEELFEELSREKALADQYGVETAFSPYGATKTPVEPDLTGGDNE